MWKSKYYYRTNKTIVLTQCKLNNNSTFFLHSSQMNRPNILIALTMSCHTILSIMCIITILKKAFDFLGIRVWATVVFKWYLNVK